MNEDENCRYVWRGGRVSGLTEEQNSAWQSYDISIFGAFFCKNEGLWVDVNHQERTEGPCWRPYLLHHKSPKAVGNEDTGAGLYFKRNISLCISYIIEHGL